MKDENGRCSEKKRRDFCAQSIRTVSYLSPCESPRAVSDGSLQHSVSRDILRGKASCCATRPPSNNSTETLQPHCLFRHLRSKLKRLARRPCPNGLNHDVMTTRTTTSYSPFFRISRPLLQDSCHARPKRADPKSLLQPATENRTPLKRLNTSMLHFATPSGAT